MNDDRRKIPYSNCDNHLVDIKDKLDDICNILTGNSNPVEGLVYKCQRNTDHRNYMEKWGWKIISLATSVPFLIVIGVLVWKIRDVP